MKTEIFKTYEDFLNREDKEVNGVSESFTKENPNYEEDNKTNKACWNCRSCWNCWNCWNCSSCNSCSSCSSCSYCSYCSSCSSCSSCSFCNDCRSCSSCSSCRSCSDFKSNPQRIVSPVLGSRGSQTTYYFTEDKEQIVCGCFKGTLKEFKAQVKEVHGGSVYGYSYLKWIAAVEIYKKAIL